MFTFILLAATGISSKLVALNWTIDWIHLDASNQHHFKNLSQNDSVTNPQVFGNPDGYHDRMVIGVLSLLDLDDSYHE